MAGFNSHYLAVVWLCLCPLLVGIALFVRRWRFEPISSRKPGVVLVLNLFIFWWIFIGYFLPRLVDVPCWLFYLSDNLLLGGIEVVFLWRIVNLVLRHERARQVVALAKQAQMSIKEGLLEFEGQKVPKFLRTRVYLADSPMLFLYCLVPLAITTVIGWPLQASSDSATMSIPLFDENDVSCSLSSLAWCLRLMHIFFVVVYAYIFARILRHTTDAFFIRNEILMAASGGVLGVLVMAALAMTSDTPYWTYPSNVLSILGSFTLYYPLWLSYHFEKQRVKQMTRLAKKHEIDSSTNISRRSSSDSMVDLETVLSSEEGMQAFENFVKSEFSAENLCFWKAVEEFRSLYSGTQVELLSAAMSGLVNTDSCSASKRTSVSLGPINESKEDEEAEDNLTSTKIAMAAYGLRIYKLYISSAGDLMVNLPARAVNPLNDLFQPFFTRPAAKSFSVKKARSKRMASIFSLRSPSNNPSPSNSILEDDVPAAPRSRQASTNSKVTPAESPKATPCPSPSHKSASPSPSHKSQAISDVVINVDANDVKPSESSPPSPRNAAPEDCAVPIRSEVVLSPAHSRADSAQTNARIINQSHSRANSTVTPITIRASSSSSGSDAAEGEGARARVHFAALPSAERVEPSKPNVTAPAPAPAPAPTDLNLLQPDSFDEAQRIIFMLMNQDSFSRFRMSSFYHQLLQTWQKEPDGSRRRSSHKTHTQPHLLELNAKV